MVFIFISLLVKNCVTSFSGHWAYVPIPSMQAFCMQICFRRCNISLQKRCTNKILHSVNVYVSDWNMTKFPLSSACHICTSHRNCLNYKPCKTPLGAEKLCDLYGRRSQARHDI